MGKGLVLCIHSLIWFVLYIVTLSVVDGLLRILGVSHIFNKTMVAEVAIALLLALAVPFYIFYFLWFSEHSGPTKLTRRAIAIFSTLTLPLGYLLIESESLTVVTYTQLLALVILFSMLGLIFRGFIQGLKLKRGKEALQKHLLQTELNFLKGQISPHFLFNTLNNIDSLITSNPQEASRSLVNMAEIMRYMVYDTKAEQVALVQELHYLSSLLELYKLRFKRSDIIKFKVQGNPSNKFIPPMLLLPIAENAFKHHSDKYDQGGIMIEILISDDKLMLLSSNAYDPYRANSHHSGTGLELLKRRLYILFSEKCKIVVRSACNIFNIELVVPLNSNIKK